MRLLSERLRDAAASAWSSRPPTRSAGVGGTAAGAGRRFGERQPGGEATIDLPLTQDELASWTGSSREAAARALRTRRGLGWVDTARRRITLRNPPALRAQAG